MKSTILSGGVLHIASKRAEAIRDVIWVGYRLQLPAAAFALALCTVDPMEAAVGTLRKLCGTSEGRSERRRCRSSSCCCHGCRDSACRRPTIASRREQGIPPLPVPSLETLLLRVSGEAAAVI